MSIVKVVKILFILGTGCIILSPTRELALQTYHVMKKLLSSTDLSHALIVGGEKKAKDIIALKKGKEYLVSNVMDTYTHLTKKHNVLCLPSLYLF